MVKYRKALCGGPSAYTCVSILFDPKSGSSDLAAPDSAFGDNKFHLLRSSPYG
jgi:hypothetical protein